MSTAQASVLPEHTRCSEPFPHRHACRVQLENIVSQIRQQYLVLALPARFLYLVLVRLPHVHLAQLEAIVYWAYWLALAWLGHFLSPDLVPPRRVLHALPVSSASRVAAALSVQAFALLAAIL